MAVEIGALRALLSLDSAAFEKGAKRAQASMGGLQRSLTKAAGKMRSVGKTMSTRVTAPFAAAAGLMVRSSLSTVDAQAKFAQSLGTTTSSIQTLTRAADMAGISQSELEGSLQRMTRRISLAEQGAGAGAKAFARLGIEASDLADLDAAERIKLIQARIAELIPTAEQAGVASQVFGDKTGLAIMRLDAATIDAANDQLERFGVHVADIDADKIEEANDAMSGLGLVVTGLGNQLAVALAPTLKTISERIADVAAWFSNLSPEMQRFIGIGAAVAAAIGPLAIALGFVATGLAALASPIGLVILAFGAVAGAVAYVVTQWDSLVQKYPGLQAALDTVGSVASRVWEIFSNTGKAAFDIAGGYIDVFTSLLKGDLTGALEASQGISETFTNYIRDTFPGVVDTISRVTEGAMTAGQEIIEAVKTGISNGIANVKTAIDELVTSIIAWFKEIPAKIVDTARQVGSDIIDGLVNGILGGKEKVASAGRNVARGTLDAAEDELGVKSPSREFMKLGEYLMSGLSIGISDNAQRAAQSAAEAAAQVTDSAGDVLESGGGTLSNFFGDIGDAVAGAITQGQNFGEAMRGVFQRIASDFISSGITGLFGSLFGSGSGSGGALGGLGSLFAGFFDAGGRIPSGKFGIAGENGPELITGPAGVISTANTSGMFGGGFNFTQQIIDQVGVKVTTEEVETPGGRLQRLVLSQAVGDAIATPGGAAARQLRNRGLPQPRPLR